MKKIFIYYSLTGNGESVSNYFKSKKFDIRKVETKEKLPKGFILKMLVGGYRALRNHKDKLIKFDNNISEYDEIVIGSPIWNDRLSCPINSVLDKLDLNNKRVIFVLYSGSGKSKKATEYLSQKFKDSKIINIKEPKTNSNYVKVLNKEIL